MLMPARGALARRAAAQAPPLARNLLGPGWQCAVWNPHLVSRTARCFGGGQPLTKLLFRPVAPKPGARSHGTELGAGAGERGWRAYWNWKLPAYATRLRIVFRFTRVIVLGYGNDSACGRHHMHTLTHARARSREPKGHAHRYARPYSKRECVLVHTLPARAYGVRARRSIRTEQPPTPTQAFFRRGSLSARSSTPGTLPDT